MKCVYAIAAAFAGLAAADSVPFPTPTTFSRTIETSNLAEATSIYTSIVGKLGGDISAYAASVTTQPEYSAFMSDLSKVLPKSEWDALTNTALTNNVLTDIATQTGAPSWWTALPSSAQSYYTSLYQAEASIYKSDLTGPAAPTGIPMMKAAAVAAAGAIGGAALLL